MYPKYVDVVAAAQSGGSKKRMNSQSLNIKVGYRGLYNSLGSIQ